MSQSLFLSPGPSQTYPSLPSHLQKALEEQIPSISHRSLQFQKIYQECDEALRHLFELPEDYQILFFSSANEIWERLLQNTVEKSSFHLVNGAFSEKFFRFSQLLQKQALEQRVPFGQGFDFKQINVPKEAEIIALTHNETSSGVCCPEEFLHSFKATHPEKLVLVDMVSSAPYPNLDFQQIDAAYFSVQKAFGLPAGLGVGLIRRTCLEKAQKLASAGLSLGTYHTLPTMWKMSEKYQTAETPNVLGIYCLGKIALDMLDKGRSKIREEIDQKTQLLYGLVQKHPDLEVFVQKEEHRSPTVIVANCSQAPEYREKLAQTGYVVGSGYKDYKNQQLRIANFPATSVEQIEAFVQDFPFN